MPEDKKAASCYREQDLERLARFTLMDDEFFSEVLNQKTEAVQYILRILLERDDLLVTQAESQVEYKSATMRSIKLDIKATDAEGRVMDIEIQRADNGSGVRRARFYSSMIDRAMLSKGEQFEDLADTYVIFITQNDKFGKGLPLYHIERKITELGDQPFGDGAHILYVNGAFQDTAHPVGKLMHDFNCADPEKFISPELQKEVAYYKTDEGGRTQMCKMIEEMRNETLHDGAVATARILLSIGKLSFDEIALSTALPLDEVKALAGKGSV